MPVEIERKFLVQGDRWRAGCTQIHEFRQGYLMSHEGAGATVRVRIFGDHAFLTIKGAKSPSRAEYEYPIPPADAEEILRSLCGDRLIEKRRHCVPHQGLIWSVDVFSGSLAGLILAEVELSHPEQPLALPSWVGPEVTADHRYRNSVLARSTTPPREKLKV
ncbi:CYTH domain-containing protein [Roseomonas elaeocarpi]|uniref:CYTH domain-containing protein n=1 Tax=Roseomonas elaeocarpi TaxID=907779 RepID=A0ABV6JLS9_9PROT